MKKLTQQDVAGVVTESNAPGKQTPPLLGGIRTQKSVLIDKPIGELYAFWRQFVNFPFFMENVVAVELLDERRSHWTVKSPVGGTVEWDAEVIESQINERISWRSTEDADIANAGSVAFRPAVGGRGTEVTVALTYNPPAGKAGHWIASLYGKEPSTQLSQDLRRFKALMETGEVPTAAMRRADQTLVAGK